MNLYSFQFIVEKLTFEKPRTPQKYELDIKCQNLESFTVKYSTRKSVLDEPLKDEENGKAILFSCSPKTLVTTFNSFIEVVVKNSSESFGVVNIKWKEFESVSKYLKGNKENVEYRDKYDIVQNGAKIGCLQFQMNIVDLGERIEFNIRKMGSRLTIPMVQRRKTIVTTKEEDEIIEDPVEGNWAPLFLSQKKERKSLMDPTMEIYAHMAGLTAPEPPETRLTPEYINNHLCGHKACPGAYMFKQYGLGPLADGSGLGTITSIKHVKPQGSYGMSQAYGTMDSYGAYGFFVKKKDKKRKTDCESPDCPYANYFDASEDLTDKESSRQMSENEMTNKKCHCKYCSKTARIKEDTCCQNCKI